MTSRFLKITIKTLLVAVIVTQVFGAAIVAEPLKPLQPKSAQAYPILPGSITAGMGTAAELTSVPEVERFNWQDFYKDVFTQVALGVAFAFAQHFTSRFVSQLIAKYKIRNYLYYDQILTNYYLTNFIRDKITDPDLRRIYVLMESEFVYGQPNGTTPGSSGLSSPSSAIVPRLRTAISEIYKEQTGIDPAVLANPPATMSNRDYLTQSQYFYFNHPGYTEANLRANFGAFQAASTTASQLEVLVGNSLKAGRYVGGYCDVGSVALSDLDNKYEDPNMCRAAGGVWKQSALDQARSFIDNPTASIDHWMGSATSSLFDMNFDPNNFWFVIGNSFGRFLTKKLFLDSPTGVLNEDPRGYDYTLAADFGYSNDTVADIDIDGDGQPDGYDNDGDGTLDYCIYGGTAPNCTGSMEALDNGGTGAPGVCSGVTTPIEHEDDLRTALDEVIATNPNGIADAFNTTENSIMFLNEVASVLQSQGLNATTDVLNGNGNPNRGDLIAIWVTGQTFAERYDAVVAAGDGDRALRDADQTSYVGHVSIADCIN